MVIRNKTILEGQEAFQTLVKTTKKSFLPKLIFTAVLAVIGLIILILSLTASNLANYITIGFMFLIIAILYGLMHLLAFLSVSKRLRKQNTELLTYGIENQFTFKEESFQVVSRVGQQTVKNEFSYLELKKIVEEDDQILFYQAMNNAFVCKKSGFSEAKLVDVFLFGLAKHKIKVQKKLSIDK